MFKKNKELIILAALATIVLFFFKDFLAAQKIIGFKDLSRYFYPLRYLVVEEAKAGLLPLWNPYIFCGYPLLASLQVCFFYPLFLLYLILPFNLAFNYYIIIHYFLAACFMYGLLKHYKLFNWPAIFGALAFAFSGYLLSVSNMNTTLSSIIWLPLIVLFFDRLLEQKSFFNWLLLSLLLAVQFLAGIPDVVIMTSIFLLAYLAFKVEDLKSFGLNLLWLVGAGLAAMALSAIQLLPFLELFFQTDRVTNSSFALLTNRSFPPREILTLILPFFFGNQLTAAAYSKVFLGEMMQDWLISPYLGLTTLAFVPLAFKDKKAGFFALFAVGALVLSFGKYTPIYNLIYVLPVISWIRYPVKYLGLVTFCLTILAAFGFNNLLLGLFPPKKIIKRYFVVALFVGLVFLGLYFWRNRLFMVLVSLYPQRFPLPLLDSLAAIVEFNLLSLFNLMFYLLALAVLTYAYYHKWLSKFYFSSLIILLLVFDLFSSNSTIIKPVSAEVFTQQPKTFQLIAGSSDLSRFMITPELDQQNRYIIGENYDQAVFNTKAKLAANWPVIYNLSDYWGYESIRPAGWRKFYEKNFQEKKLLANLKLLSQANVKYLGTTKKFNDSQLKLLYQNNEFGRNFYLYENLSVKPRAYLVKGRGQVEIVSYKSNQIIIEAKMKTGGELFLSERYYPGWQALVDGKKVEIKKGRQFFRLIELPVGSHKIEFSYQPISFRLGSLISLTTILLLLYAIIKRKKGLFHHV